MEIKTYEWYSGVKDLELSNKDCEITLNSKGDIEVRLDGHGGWNCCSSHSTYMSITIEQAAEVIKFLEGFIANELMSRDCEPNCGCGLPDHG